MKYKTGESKDGMLIIKLLYPLKNTWLTIDEIVSLLLKYGDGYKIVDFGISISSKPSTLDFLTNLPLDLFNKEP